jgi:hypothetical protein
MTVLYTCFKVDPVPREFGLAALCAWAEVGILVGALVGVALHNGVCNIIQ